MGYPRKDMGPVEILWDRDRVPQKGHGTSGSIMGWRWGTPGVDRLKTLPSVVLRTRAVVNDIVRDVDRLSGQPSTNT